LAQLQQLKQEALRQAATITHLSQAIAKKDQDLAKKDQDLANKTQQCKQVPFDFFDGCSGWI
jgi:hypothetical protein